MLMYFWFKDNPLHDLWFQKTIEVHSDSSEEDAEKVVDWTPETLSTLSEVREETVDDGNDEEVGEV